MLLTELTGTYSDGYRDQNAIIYLLKKHADEYIPHVEFVGKEFCFNCFWKDLLEVGSSLSAPAWAPALWQHNEKMQPACIPSQLWSLLPCVPTSVARELSLQSGWSPVWLTAVHSHGNTPWALTVLGLIWPGLCHFCLHLGGAFVIITFTSKNAPA